VDNYCDGCGEYFDDSFELIDHFLEDNEDEFDPVLVLPNGYKFMIGSLLRFMFEHADSPEDIRQITQSSYVTLFAAETQLEGLEDIILDMVIETEMLRFDSSLKSLLEEGNPDDEIGK